MPHFYGRKMVLKRLPKMSLCHLRSNGSYLPAESRAESLSIVSFDDTAESSPDESVDVWVMLMTSSINVSKREPRKPFSVEILRDHQDYYFFEVRRSFACVYWGAHGFRYYTRLSDGQKMAHMIKISWLSLTVEISTPKNEKFIFFRSRYSLLNYADAYVFLFFVFESHDREIDQQTNLPIDSYSHYC